MKKNKMKTKEEILNETDFLIGKTMMQASIQEIEYVLSMIKATHTRHISFFKERIQELNNLNK